MDLLRQMFRIIPKTEYANCIAVILLILLSAVIEVFGVGLIFPLISIIENPHYLEQFSFFSEAFPSFREIGHRELVITLSVILIGTYFLKNAYLAWSTRFQIQFMIRNQVHYSKELLKFYLAKPYIYHVNNNTAILIRNVTAGTQVIFGSILLPMFQLVTEILTAIAIWLMLLIVDAVTALFVAITLLVILAAILRLSKKKIAEQGAVLNQCSVHVIKWINQALGAIKETKIMHKEEFFAKRFELAYQKKSEAQGAFDFISQMPRLIIETFIVSILLLLIIIKLYSGYAMSNVVPLLSVMALAAFRLMPSANRIIGYVNSIKLQIPFFNELYSDFIYLNNTVSQYSFIGERDKSPKLHFEKIIEIRDLMFSYPEMKGDILQGVSFQIPKSAFVGIIGPSGAGKTTFVDVFLGLLSPSKGSILVDGIDISNNILGWQENLAYVPQDIYLIDGSILENIALGQDSRDVDEAKINTILKMVDMDEFILGLPGGVHTNVGERGIKLSGGQKQRIGLARALFQEPEILVLDEATSALDNETEKNIMETIFKLKGKITILSIAHRVSTLSECDFKVEFVNGKAVIHSKISNTM